MPQDNRKPVREPKSVSVCSMSTVTSPAACSAVGGSPSSSQPARIVSAGTVAGNTAARATPMVWIENANRYSAAGPARMPCASACSAFSHQPSAATRAKPPEAA